jgi:hypothetical protein
MLDEHLILYVQYVIAPGKYINTYLLFLNKIKEKQEDNLEAKFYF